jgi:hypothetical protein
MVSLEELVLLATVVAIWMPACAASPDGTCTKTAGSDAVKALIVSHSLKSSYSPWKLQLAQDQTRRIQARIYMPANADRKRPQCTRHLTFCKMQWRKVSHDVSYPTNQNHYRKLFRASLINHKKTESKSRNLR